MGVVVVVVVVLLVAPCAGAWIEMCELYHGQALPHVAPCAGAWIEIRS